HLGMTGVLSSAPPERPSHLRVSVDLGGSGPAPVILGAEQADGSRLYFTDIRRFGRFLLTPAGDWQELPTLHAMGPEPLGAEFTPEGLAAAFTRSGSAVKTYLLSQRPVAGLGNIYVDEALWRAGIHPQTPASEVASERIAPLHEAIRAVLEASIEAQGTTLSDYRTVGGGEGGFQELLDVYGRTGEACRRCGRELQRIVLGGRSTHFCPDCQAR
ncbi:MAG TPA: zinc finger domain-containing protein, partial [Deinococcales bacterium]|nr:zinc finger domain-containing protein [Deinococcales bacterium]